MNQQIHVQVCLLRLWTSSPVLKALFKLTGSIKQYKVQLQVQQSNMSLREKKTVALNNRKNTSQRDVLDLNSRLQSLAAKLPGAASQVHEQEENLTQARLAVLSGREKISQLQANCSILQSALAKLHASCEETIRTVELHESVQTNQTLPSMPAATLGQKRGRTLQNSRAKSSRRAPAAAVPTLPLPPPVQRRVQTQAAHVPIAARYRTLALAETRASK